MSATSTGPVSPLASDCLDLVRRLGRLIRSGVGDGDDASLLRDRLRSLYDQLGDDDRAVVDAAVLGRS